MKSNYAPIKGLGTGFGSLQIGVRVRLYAGPDHLLLVQNTGYSEEYKRVFFRDIRYIAVRKTNGQIYAGILSGLLFLGVFLLNLTPMYWWLADLLSLPFLIWFFMNWLQGQACICQINTEVQILDLPTPRRMNKVPILVAFLRDKTTTAPPDVSQVAA